MTNPEDKIEQLGLILPAPKSAVANYLPYTQTGNLLLISGQGPVTASGDAIKGRLGENIEIEDGQRAAQLAALNLLAQVKSALHGDWSRFGRCLRLCGFVNSTPNFTHHPAIINGASDLMVELFGDNGRHSRSAVGVTSLPMGWAVEIDAIFEVH
ncbi:MAG: RidA family protein [Candidatus Micropelagos thuwalensis]